MLKRMGPRAEGGVDCEIHHVSIANGGNSKKEGGETHDVDSHSPIKRHEEGESARNSC